VGGADTLAYTTVVTILTRLFEKNALSRERDGRAYRYAPVADEAGYLRPDQGAKRGNQQHLTR
jgi:predicted transcriptional regulator